MATRAVFSFLGFAGVPVRHLCLHHDGYPTGAAWRLATALRHSPSPDGLLDAFLRSQPGAVALDDPEAAADAEYRYRIERLGGAEPRLEVRAWVRLPGTSAWRPRCGPLPLAAFLERFLPGGLPG